MWLAHRIDRRSGPTHCNQCQASRPDWRADHPILVCQFFGERKLSFPTSCIPRQKKLVPQPASPSSPSPISGLPTFSFPSSTPPIPSQLVSVPSRYIRGNSTRYIRAFGPFYCACARLFTRLNLFFFSQPFRLARFSPHIQNARPSYPEASASACQTRARRAPQPHEMVRFVPTAHRRQDARPVADNDGRKHRCLAEEAR